MITLTPDRTSPFEPLVVNPPADLRTYNTKILLAMPWQKMAHPITAFVVAQLADKRRVSLSLNYGDAFCGHARNAIVDHFLASNLEWVFMVDDDMILPFGNAEWWRMYTGWPDYPEPFASFNVIDRLLSHNKTLVGVSYFGKHKFGMPVFCEGANKQEADFVRRGPHDICKPTKWVGTGAALFHRSVFEDIEKTFPNLSRAKNGGKGQWFTSSEHSAMDWIKKTKDMLSVGPMDGQKAFKAYEMLTAAEVNAKATSCLGIGEDVQVCLRATAAGHQPHVDLGVIAGHLGACVWGPLNTSQK